MKNILSTLTVLFILLTSSVSWGNVDGKGLYCTNKKTLDTHSFNAETAFVFKNGTVQQLSIRRKNDKYSIRSFWKPHRYFLNDEQIKWNFPFNDFFLNRKTLRLEIKDEKTADSIMNSLIRLKVTFDCEVFPNHNKLKSRLGIDLKRKQQKYDKKIKDNNI